ncbi:uncharacterized protein LOC107270899 isoform X2 [Cephus cinctus]|uniref:Uncharacterized protein LOC107270899 isoform X2 n=1 Tax=Cephus cinctus TaxID=211228 RepID=A0AAJ7C4I9_CEPCN|nr:uncharacterized protein LOC107270899 isoform X2 [Cephus cinctus]XP_015601819.1 uncharacterized protein LOC107270899 isoform X2 [Cephus cinctus]XP_015601820.1 uncharacterized protein LOC107270899 isoform X2 [Cephus cinctus]XP_024943973.1 uncharacterized protein LOC107270899 isoform X2 [Cephus cinctus]XP_024943974.1 uncharacterized protein LOC107270899 isoform X2 [Cephus cinctus]
MARAGTQRWRNPAPEGDDVQRSIELLDKVLSEYDEHETEAEVGGGVLGVVGGLGEVVGVIRSVNAGDCGSNTEPSIGLTPDDESPSLGHQSEDDGYMSMNGRKAKMALVALRPVPDCPEPQDPVGLPPSEFPPPPEEAERIISTLLPMVSPGNSTKRSTQSSGRRSGRQQWMAAMDDKGHGHAVTTQTTLPKTRHQRPYGWENENVSRKIEPFRLSEPPSPPNKFASLPYDAKVSFDWIPPRTNPAAVERHREVRRRSSEEEDMLPERRRNHHHRHNHQHPNEGSTRSVGGSDRVVNSQNSRKQSRQNEITKSSSVEDHRLLANHGRTTASDRESRRRNNSDSSEGRFSRNSESERSSIPRSSSVSVERFSMRANCDSSDFSRANSTSNERFHSDFSIAVASASSNDHVSVPTSDPFSIRNLDFSFSLPRADSAERFSGRTSDRCSEERYSDMFSTRNSDFSTRNSADFRTQSEEEEHFSDDSLEELLPPPPPISKRHSIAWEVSLEDDPLYAPGSTKVVGRRRRKSSDISSVGSASKLRDFDDWPDPPLSTTEDDLVSPYSDSSTNDLDQIRPQDLTKNGTYVIRRGRKRERKVLPKTSTKTKSLSFENCEDNRLSDVKRYSSTFDNIKSLLKEGKLEGLDEPPPDFPPPVPPDLVRGVSLPVINDEFENRSELDVPDEQQELSLNKNYSEIGKKRNSTDLSPLPASPRDNDEDDNDPNHHAKNCLKDFKKKGSYFREKRECNGLAGMTTSKSLDGKVAGSTLVTEEVLIRSANDRLDTKIPVNILIEDQIVKKALTENRRQLEKVSDAIKEIESVKNSESYDCKRWRNGETKSSSKRNSYENDNKVVDNLFDNRTKKQHSSDSETSKTSSEGEFDRRKTNSSDVYSSGRRLRQNGIENHKNDQKQIENVIDAILEDSKNPEFQVSVEVLEFPPLPPSPVEEADEESSDVGNSAVISTKSKSHSNRTMDYRPRVPPHRSSTESKDHQLSLNTRSMDAGFARGRRTPASSNSRREVPVERRTLPTDLPGPSRRRPFTKRHSPSAEACTSSGSAVGAAGAAGCTGIATGSGMQTSCSLPETPVFARGSDIPRTPQHAGNPGQSRRQPGWYAPTTVTTGYRRNNPGLEQAIIGTELLRLAGGPNRGWYPTRKANQPRPASIEHLERLNNAYDGRLPGSGEQRKPLTLPTNITPNKYFGQSKHSSASSTREALRRVTSLLIKKGSGSKEGKGKDTVLPSGPYSGETADAPKKKGFFKSFWKRSRHYSLENQ